MDIWNPKPNYLRDSISLGVKDKVYFCNLFEIMIKVWLIH